MSNAQVTQYIKKHYGNVRDAKRTLNIKSTSILKAIIAHKLGNKKLSQNYLKKIGKKRFILGKNTYMGEPNATLAFAPEQRFSSLYKLTPGQDVKIIESPGKTYITNKYGTSYEKAKENINNTRTDNTIHSPTIYTPRPLSMDNSEKLEYGTGSIRNFGYLNSLSSLRRYTPYLKEKEGRTHAAAVLQAFSTGKLDAQQTFNQLHYTPSGRRYLAEETDYSQYITDDRSKEQFIKMGGYQELDTAFKGIKKLSSPFSLFIHTIGAELNKIPSKNEYTQYKRNLKLEKYLDKISNDKKLLEEIKEQGLGIKQGFHNALALKNEWLKNRKLDDRGRITDIFLPIPTKNYRERSASDKENSKIVWNEIKDQLKQAYKQAIRKEQLEQEYETEKYKIQTSIKDRKERKEALKLLKKEYQGKLIYERSIADMRALEQARMGKMSVLYTAGSIPANKISPATTQMVDVGLAAPDYARAVFIPTPMNRAVGRMELLDVGIDYAPAVLTGSASGLAAGLTPNVNFSYKIPKFKMNKKGMNYGMGKTFPTEFNWENAWNKGRLTYDITRRHLPTTMLRWKQRNMFPNELALPNNNMMGTTTINQNWNENINQNVNQNINQNLHSNINTNANLFLNQQLYENIHENINANLNQQANFNLNLRIKRKRKKPSTSHYARTNIGTKTKLYKTWKEALHEGATLTDNTKATSYITQQSDKAPTSKGRLTTKTLSKFIQKGRHNIEKQQYRHDKPKERGGSFNWLEHLKASQ